MTLEIIHAYLFGGVKFLDLLLLMMGVDIITGILKAIKLKKLRSRTSWFGYARKIGVLCLVIVAAVIDTILGFNGAVTLGTVLFYIAGEGLSIVENLAQIGVKVPAFIREKLQVIQDEKSDK
jgi:toxin secretion/phage lysis holin